jgi:nucleoside-diphosphate-sugar epimerase
MGRDAMSRTKTLVTGGCGFVGRRFVKYLLDQEHEVTIVDDLSTGTPLPKWPDHLRPNADQESLLTVHYCDFRDYAKEAKANFDLILHLAAVVGGRLVIDGDPLKVATDLAIDATFFSWVIRQKPLPKKVLYFSSSAAYPIAEQTALHHRPLAEGLINFDAALGLPDMTYGWSKLTGEFLARHAVASYGLDVVIYRPFSGYGEEQDFSYPFPSIVRRVAQYESPIVVWGSGQQQRDFIHINDVVNAVFASAYRLQPGEALNLGSGEGVPFSELARRACSVIGHEAEIVSDSSKPEGVFARVGDCTRMFRYYHPVITLKEGIERVYRYLLANGLEREPESVLSKG